MSTVVVETEFSARGTTSGSMLFAVEPGQSTGGHSHPSEEIWIVRSGKGRVELDGVSRELEASDAPLVVPAGVYHRVFASGSEDLVILSLWWRASE